MCQFMLEYVFHLPVDLPPLHKCECMPDAAMQGSRRADHSGPQIIDYLLGLLSTTPEALKDAERETPEEVQERYERTLASSLQSLGMLVGECLFCVL